MSSKVGGRGGLFSAPTPLASNGSTEADAADAIVAHPFIDYRRVLKVGAGCCAALNTALESSRNSPVFRNISFSNRAAENGLR